MSFGRPGRRGWANDEPRERVQGSVARAVQRLGTAWLAPVDWSVQYDSAAGLLQLVDHRQDGIVKG